MNLKTIFVYLVTFIASSSAFAMRAVRLDDLRGFDCSSITGMMTCTKDVSGYRIDIDTTRTQNGFGATDTQGIAKMLAVALDNKSEWHRVLLCLQHNEQGMLWGIVLYPQVDSGEAFFIKPSYENHLDKSPILWLPSMSWPVLEKTDLEICINKFR